MTKIFCILLIVSFIVFIAVISLIRDGSVSNKVGYTVLIISAIVVIVSIYVCFFAGVESNNTDSYNGPTNSYNGPTKWTDSDGNVYTDQNDDGEYDFSDYIQEQDPDLYNDIKDRYENLQ